MDTFTEVTHRNVFQRLGSSLKAIIFGGVLFLGSFPILFINEGCAVKDYKRLGEAKAAAVEAPSDAVMPNNDGELLVVSGLATTDDEVADPEFNLRLTALRLNRRVEMYQWEEDSETSTKKKVGGGETTEKTYSYKTTWSDDLIRSSDFQRPQGHENPKQMPVTSSKFLAEHVTLGAFRLNEELVSRISNNEDVSLTETEFVQMPEPKQSEYALHQGLLYRGQDPNNPTVGDVKVRFEKVLPTDVTVRARQSQASFSPWASSSGATVHEIRMGTLSAAEMHEKAMSAAKARTWFTRLGGFFAMGLGLSIILGPLAVMADVLPFLGNLVRSGTAIVAFVIAALLSLVVIALAWFTYRPMLSVPLLIGAGALAVWIVKRGRTKANTPPPLRQEDTPPPLNL